MAAGFRGSQYHRMISSVWFLEAGCRSQESSYNGARRQSKRGIGSL